MERSIWKIVFFVIILLACLGGCVWITFNQVAKYLEKTSIVSTSLEPRNISFPDLMFCNRKAFKDTQNNSNVDIETLSLKSYQSLSEFAPNVTFDSILRDNLNDTIPTNYQVLHQATKFNGNCKIFQAEYVMEEKVYYTFTYQQDKELILMILPRNEYIYAVGHNWKNLPPNMLSLEGDHQIEMEIIEYSQLPNGHKSCNVEIDEAEFMECFRSTLWGFLILNEFDCMPHFFANFLLSYNSSLPECQEGNPFSKLLYRFHSKELLSYAKHRANAKCNHPCTESWFEIVQLDLTYMEETSGNLTGGRNKILFSLSSPLVTVSKESLLYDFTAIVSSIGGGVGIFLGFSCFGMLSSALSKLYAKLYV